jgi:hypothetical protein
MARKKPRIDLRKLSEGSNPLLKELLAEITGDGNSDDIRPSAKQKWGRRFNASGKPNGVAPKIRNRYEE